MALYKCRCSTDACISDLSHGSWKHTANNKICIHESMWLYAEQREVNGLDQANLALTITLKVHGQMRKLAVMRFLVEHMPVESERYEVSACQKGTSTDFSQLMVDGSNGAALGIKALICAMVKHAELTSYDPMITQGNDFQKGVHH